MLWGTGKVSKSVLSVQSVKPFYQLCLPENVVFHSTFNKNVSSQHALSELLHVWTESEKFTG